MPKARTMPVLFTLILLFSLPAWAGLISTSKEIEIGRNGAAQLEMKYGTVSDPAKTALVQRLGQKLSQHGTRGLSYRFSILRSKDINALAFPGGFVYVTEGIMAAMPEEQLAFVMGHEIGHVECKHSVRQLESSAYRQAGTNLLLGIFSRGKTNKYAQTAANAANNVISNQYSQGAEKEADRMGIELMAKAGYNPIYSISALKTLQKLGGKPMSGFMNSLLGSHPLTSDRIKLAEQIVPTVPFTPQDDVNGNYTGSYDAPTKY